ncbi:acyl-CoA dehydrogenase family protein [Pseudonocardia sp. NPDC049154]|uniref:acyl-CoA dehydrogenase family protein n=1 Tax=Pseudonocardia sp. NPDC049154 TaxID=3155501 RepID=UPI0033E4DCF5
MDLSYPPAADDFREEIRGFLREHLPQGWTGWGALPPAERETFVRDWRALLVEHRFLGLTWPAEYGGGGRGLLEQSILIEEFVRIGVPFLPHPNDTFSLNLLGPTLLHAGTEEQRSRFLRPTLTGEMRWAQGFSEPDAGSDLFNLRTRGVVDGDELVLDGQKVWQTAGTTANWMFTLVRTDPAASRAKGLSFVLVPLDQPGVEVRGIRTAAGEVEFAEVFLTGARAALGDVVGGLGNGAAVALALLGYERGAGGVAAALGMAIELERLVELARANGAAADARLRSRVGACWTRVHVLRCVALRALSAGLEGKPPGPESSLVKALTAEHHQVATELAMDILGPAALTPNGPQPAEWLRPQPRGFDPLSSTAWVSDFLNARAGTIYGGSSEIQRTTIAERILGLPAEVRGTAR